MTQILGFSLIGCQHATLLTGEIPGHSLQG